LRVPRQQEKGIKRRLDTSSRSKFGQK